MDWENTNLIVDGYDVDSEYLNEAKKTGRFRNLFLDCPDIKNYDSLVICGVLEHVDSEESFLKSLKEASSIFFTVPNASSFHRKLGVKLGFLNDEFELSSQDYSVGHKRYYDSNSLQYAVEKYLGKTHEIKFIGSHSFKIGSNAQMIEFASVCKELDEVSQDCNLTGNNNFFGAELALLAVKK